MKLILDLNYTEFSKQNYETNFERTAERKEIKYRPLLKHFESTYRKIKFINLSKSSLGISGQASESFFDACKELGIEKSHLKHIAIKMSKIIISITYYIFCMRNKPWTDPELLSYWHNIVKTIAFFNYYYYYYYDLQAN